MRKEIYEKQVDLQYELGDIRTNLIPWRNEVLALLEEDDSLEDLRDDMLKVTELLDYIKFKSY